MSHRIYYNDAQCVEFDAVVSATAVLDGRPAATLDTTAFYPTSGGQPHDTGTLGDARVVDVVESASGDVWHVVDREIEVGRRVRGVVDRGRRFDHMQQHTGQHLLSAAFDRLHHARTVGFHLGAVVSTVDLSIDLPAPAIAAGEAGSSAKPRRPRWRCARSPSEAARSGSSTWRATICRRAAARTWRGPGRSA